jgi:hypothetical protein
VDLKFVIHRGSPIELIVRNDIHLILVAIQTYHTPAENNNDVIPSAQKRYFGDHLVVVHGLSLDGNFTDILLPVGQNHRGSC